jgi:Zn-dependent protease with chaperone function
VPHQFSLSNQTFLQWFWERIKELGVAMVLTAIAAALALFAIQRFRRWWLMVWLGSIPLMIFMVVIAPVVIDPIFNRFEPLRDQVLRERLLGAAARAGIEGSRVYEVDKSKQTKTLNAYVTGIGPTKRIVMWDTLLEKMSHDEVVAVMGHEMAHYVLHHLWKGLGFTIAAGFLVLLIAQRLYEARLGRWEIRGRGDPASLPWLLIIVLGLMFVLEPVTNGVSRYLEHEADRFGLDLTHLSEASATSLIKLAEVSKVNPRPHPFIEFWRYSHPSLARRVEFALSYRPSDATGGIAQPLDQ